MEKMIVVYDTIGSEPCIYYAYTEELHEKLEGIQKTINTENNDTSTIYSVVELATTSPALYYCATYDSFDRCTIDISSTRYADCFYQSDDATYVTIYCPFSWSLEEVKREVKAIYHAKLQET